MNMKDKFFAMGFCKAAEEHGIDPVALAKFAATNETTKASAPLQTGGYAPEGVADIGTDAVPLYRPPYYTQATDGSVRIQPGTGRPYAMTSPYQLSPSARWLRGDDRHHYLENPAVMARARAKPAYRDWLIAHSKALDAVSDAAKDVGGTDRGSSLPTHVIDPELNKMLAELYHSIMQQQTNSPANAVSTAKWPC